MLIFVLFDLFQVSLTHPIQNQDMAVTRANGNFWPFSPSVTTHLKSSHPGSEKIEIWSRTPCFFLLEIPDSFALSSHLQILSDNNRYHGKTIAYRFKENKHWKVNGI
jgi:hypothetical protein